MIRLYENNGFEILFDPNKNVLVQHQVKKPEPESLSLHPQDRLSWLIQVINFQLFDHPVHNFEAELEIILFEHYPYAIPLA